MRRMMRLCTVVVRVVSGTALLGAGVAAHPTIAGAAGTTAVWDGGGDGVHLADAANWADDTVPGSGSVLDLHAARCSLRSPLDNDLPDGTLLAGLRAPTTWCAITGATISLSGSLDATGLVLRAPLTLSGDATVASGTVRPVALDLAGHHLRIDGTVDPNLGPASAVDDSVGTGSITVGAGGALWAHGGAHVPVVVEGAPTPAPTTDALWLRGSWGAVDATGTTLDAADASFDSVHLHGARLRPWGPVTVAGDLVLDDRSSLHAGGDFTPDYALHVLGDLELDAAGFVTTAQGSVTHHLDVATVDGQVVGDFAGVSEGMVFGVGTQDAFRFSYRGGNGNDPTLDWVQPDVGPTGTTAPGGATIDGDADGEVGQSATERLPETGRDTPGLVAFGLVASALGVAALAFARRRPV